MDANFTRALPALRDALEGQVLLPADPGYPQARQIWNAMIDRRPAVIVHCASVDDVRPALQFARRHDLEIAVRGAGHNIAGTALCDGGLLIDLSGLRSVETDPQARRATVQPGATLADFDASTQRHGLATPVGVNSTTGIAGLTLGAGFGWLTRQHGMTVDNLCSADVVTADGAVLRASADENGDLFWGLRGGGGNFGIVTRFEFALHPVGPEILAGLVVYPLEQGPSVLRRWREFVAAAPESLTVMVVVRHAPPLPFLAAEAHGRKVVVVAFAGTAADAESLAQPLLALGDPLGSHIARQPYQQWQQAFDPLLTPGARNYWKSHNFTQLGDEMLDTVVEFGNRLPTQECEMFIAHIAGAPNRVAPDATAYVQRDARFVLNVHGRWQAPGEDAAGIAWARAVFTACAPFASGGAYTNFMTADEGARIESAYGANYPRLQRLKRRYDPDNVFHLNQNVRPAAV
ncbi:MAG: FAD-binding oxidoreductase [Lautropia sp.]